MILGYPSQSLSPPLLRQLQPLTLFKRTHGFVIMSLQEQNIMSPPASPTLDRDEAGANSTPVTVDDASDPHVWRPQQPGEVRSPCPALNTLANHSYL
jgi:hypothetical protein